MNRDEYKSTGYELFILALSILSLVNWTLYFLPIDGDVFQVVLVMDILLSLIFLADFIYRMKTATSAREYFFRQYGWLDLLGSVPLPQFKIARVGRILRALRLMRTFGIRSMIREFTSNEAGSAVYTVLFLIILMLEFGSISILYAEKPSNAANITSAGDAIWWTIVTVSTVGYGDFYPVTLTGRLVAIVVILVGVGLFGVVTGFLANRFLPDEEIPAEEPVAILESEPDSISGILQEIGRLRRDQEESQAAFYGRLDALLTMLEKQQKPD